MGIRTIVAIFILSCVSVSGYAQKFSKAAGLRLGHINGLSYQKHYNDHQAFEVMLNFEKDGVQGAVLNEWFSRVPFDIPEDFYFYYGVGGHMGYKKYSREKLSYNWENQIVYDYSKKGYYSVGIDAIGGVEYRVYEIPMTIGMEVQPVLDFYGLRYVHFDFFNVQVSLKYIF